jgi:putative membrane protein
MAGVLLSILIVFIALEHLYFMWLEMFAWTTRAKKVFRQFPEHLFEPTQTLAANQGLYNGFLAAGLIWSLFIEHPYWKLYVGLFFTLCVSLAGIFGAITASRKIFYVQGLPALFASGLIIYQLIG